MPGVGVAPAQIFLYFCSLRARTTWLGWFDAPITKARSDPNWASITGPRARWPATTPTTSAATSSPAPRTSASWCSATHYALAVLGRGPWHLHLLGRDATRSRGARNVRCQRRRGFGTCATAAQADRSSPSCPRRRRGHDGEPSPGVVRTPWRATAGRGATGASWTITHCSHRVLRGHAELVGLVSAIDRKVENWLARRVSRHRRWSPSEVRMQAVATSLRLAKSPTVIRPCGFGKSARGA
jgi:hypothetical protein